MADTIERTIYKLEIDDSGYIRGVESALASTNKFTQVQEAANKRLQTNEAALKANAEEIEKNRKALEAYTGTNARYRQQLENDIKKSEAEQIRLTKLVDESRAAYDRATKSAAEFATTTVRANQLQPQAGARIAPQPVLPQANPLASFNAGELADIVQNTTSDFTALAAAIELAEQAMAGLDQESEEFKTLAPIVEQGKAVLKEYQQAAEAAADSQGSLRSQIRLGREELVKLEEQGKGNTKEYFELEKRVAKLTDAFGDQQARIKILASDTKLLDFGKGAITAATSAFQAYTSVSILAGDQSEELQKKTMQLFAAMQLLQSLEQLSNLTRREGVLATLAQSGAQAAYTAVVGASTGALRVFRLALAATGIGAVIVGIGFLVSKFAEFRKAQEEAAEQQKLLNEVNEEAIKSFSGEVTHLTLIKSKLTDLSIPQKERIKLAKEYNKTAEEGNKIDLKQIDNINLVNEAIENQIKVIERRAKAKAAENILTQRFETLFLAQEKARLKAGLAPIIAQNVGQKTTGPELKVGDVVPVFDPKSGKLKDVKLTQKDIDAFKKEAVKANVRLANQLVASDVEQAIANDPAVKEAQDAVNKALSLGLINIDDLIKPDTGKDTKRVENVFAQKLKELQAKLAEVTAKSFESEGTIRAQFKASLEKEIVSINDLVKDKKLTKEQSQILIDLTARINEVQLNEALDQFNKKVTDARKKLNDELLDLQNKNTEDQLNLIQDEFERRAALIDFNEKEAIADSKQNTIDRLAALELDKLLLGEQAYQDAKAIIVTQGEQEVNNITAKFANERKNLSADVFKKSLDLIQQIFDEKLLRIDEKTSVLIQKQKEALGKGDITYKEFQESITRILKNESALRNQIRLKELNTELDSINKRLQATTDATEKADLLKRQQSVRGAIADINKQTTDVVDPNAKRVETLQDYVTQVGALADSVIQFWQKANEAESAALDRSITLQERRVEAAQRIAERGNAQYLKLEEDRLKELQIKRENAARRDLAINAALQASQLLVGITGAIAKIATPGIGIAETIGAIAVIFSSLASGYALAKSLQGNQPTFFTGTKNTGRGGKEDHKGGFTATLHPNEAVIPADRNKEYKPVIDAVYDRKIPAEDLNRFVTTYHKIKSVPQPNYTRIKEAAELKTGSDGKMAVLLSEHSSLLKRNNELQEQILKKKIHVENKIDRDGVSSMVTDFIRQQEIDKHT